MASLYLDRRGIELSLEGRTLAVRDGDGRRGTVPLTLLERVVVYGNARFDAAVIAGLADAGVGLVVLAGRGGRKRAVIPGLGHGDASRRLGQYRACQDMAWRQRWSTSLVRRKLLAQRRLLRRAMAERPDLRRPLFQSASTLDRLLVTVEDGADQPRARLRGLEGAGAAAFFRGYVTLFPPAFEFRTRNRRPPRDPINALLSLGYTLLHGEAVLACHAAGLDPMLGLYHDLAWGRESLASDLVESLRPKVDEWVWREVRAGTFRPADFSRTDGACVLGKEARGRFYGGVEAALATPRRALHRIARRLGRAMGEQALKRLPEAAE